MNIKIDIHEKEMTVTVSGKLDTTSTPKFDSEVSPKLNDISSLTIDMTDLAYISSAGLRVLLMYHKKMNKSDGKMVVKNPNELVSEVFDATGFSDILNIEND